MGIAADFALILVAGMLLGLLAHRLGQPPLIGYIVAGIVVGPYTLGPSVQQVHEVELLAEIGVALLLFALGLEVSFRDLAPVRGIALIGAPIQIALTLAFGYGIGRVLLGLDAQSSIWLGAMVSLSSTMVVLKTLLAQGVLGTLASRVMIGILIVQDLAVVPLLIVLPELGDVKAGLAQVAAAAVRAGLFLAAVILVGTKLMPGLLRRIARLKSRELFLVAVVTLALGVGYGTYLFGLSFAFGAFVAGIVLSESEFSHQALGDIIPLRDVFGLVFFASAGMLLDPNFLVANAARILEVVVLVVAGKALILGLLTRAFGYGNHAPWIVGLGLSQVGEFSFVLAREGLRLGFLTREVYSLAIAVALVSMATTPLLQKLAVPLHRLSSRWLPSRPFQPIEIPREGVEDHVVVVGYGRTGQAAAAVMRSTGVPFVVVDTDHARVEDCAATGAPAIWGDGMLEPVLAGANLGRARMLLVTIPDAAGIRMVVRRAKEMRPEIVIVARAPYREHVDELQSLGVHEVVQPESEAGLEMVRQVLVQFDYSLVEVQRFIDAVRRETYRPVLEQRQASEALRALADLRRAGRGFEIEWISLPSTAELAGRTLKDIDLRRRTGVSVVALRDLDGLHPNPDADRVLLPGDLLGVIGTEEQRRAAREHIGGA